MVEWSRNISKTLEVYTAERKNWFDKKNVAEIRLSKQNVPFEGIKYYVHGTVTNQKEIGLAKDYVPIKFVRNRWFTYKTYKGAKKKVTTLKREWGRLV